VTVDGRDLINGRAWAGVLAETRTLRWLGRALLALRMSWLLTPIVWLLDKIRGRLGWIVKPGPGPVRFP
jgi:hypothetical protein